MSESEQRDEGGILPWPKDAKDPQPGELDPQQFTAAVKAHELFVGMANRKEKPAPRESELDCFLPRLDAHRGNHTILIDGTRGSGKTAVMLRLLQDWSDKLRRLDVPETPLDTLQIKLEGGVQLVPVGLLDLEAVPQTANLATRIAGMFERVVSAMERRGTKNEGTSSAPTWALLQDDTLKSREKWQSFVGAAALEWDRSLERRRASIDPEAYAVEVEQAERKGLQARECFRAFIDALVKDWTGWQQQGKRPFFIVPIDDADLNPARVVELFGLLRTLWHPRVGYLLTGDSGLFMHVLTTHFRSQIDMPQLGGPMTGGLFRVQLVPDEGRQAERLARDYYHKAVSLENCLRLQPLPGGMRLDFIKKALSRIKSVPLADYFGANDLSALALPARWRKLKDLRDYVESSENLTPAHLALQIWKDALDDSSLVGDELDSMRKVALDDALRFSSLKIPYIHTDLSYSERYAGELASVEVLLGLKHRGVLGPVPKSSDPGWSYDTTDAARHGISLLDDSVVAAYLLMMNLAGGTSGGSPTLALSTYLGIERNAQGVSLNMLKLSWLAPYTDRPYKNQLLLQAWNERVRSVGGDIAMLAKMYVSIVLKAWSWCESDLSDWRGLASVVIDRLGFEGKKSGDRYDGWCVRVGLLAAPEWGLPKQDANAWLDALKSCAISAGKWEILRESLGRARYFINSQCATSALRLSGEGIVKTLVREIDARASGYDWMSLIQDPTP